MTKVHILFNEIRQACQAVAEQAGQVGIIHDRLAAYAASLPAAAVPLPELDPDRHYLGHGDDTTAFFLVLDAINFGSGYFPHLRKRPGMSGYFTVAAELTDRFRASGPIPAAALAEFTPAECSALFRQDPANEPVQELMGLFATAWNDLGQHLLRRFHGSFAGLVEAAGGSAEALAESLAAMPFFLDVEPYRDFPVPFYKRAQLTAADLSLAFGGEGPGRFHDLHRLTIFADNLVPHVLRMDGILRYSPALEARIEAGELIPARSEEEVEIRAGAVHAVELLTAELRRTGRPATALSLDYLLWNRGQQPAYKARPRHRTRTVFY